MHATSNPIQHAAQVMQTFNKATGEKEAISFRCIDMDRQVPHVMGVSKVRPAPCATEPCTTLASAATIWTARSYKSRAIQGSGPHLRPKPCPPLASAAPKWQAGPFCLQD